MYTWKKKIKSKNNINVKSNKITRKTDQTCDSPPVWCTPGCPECSRRCRCPSRTPSPCAPSPPPSPPRSCVWPKRFLSFLAILGTDTLCWILLEFLKKKYVPFSVPQMIFGVWFWKKVFCALQNISHRYWPTYTYMCTHTNTHIDREVDIGRYTGLQIDSPSSRSSCSFQRAGLPGGHRRSVDRTGRCAPRRRTGWGRPAKAWQFCSSILKKNRISKYQYVKENI